MYIILHLGAEHGDTIITITSHILTGGEEPTPLQD
jgi:hypothetical protein